jgi:formate hydrogenlyase subunit 4
VFLAGPVVTLAATLAAALLVPLGHHAAVIAFPGDMILFAYLLALGRFFTAAAALDTGSPFEAWVLRAKSRSPGSPSPRCSSVSWRSRA